MKPHSVQDSLLIAASQFNGSGFSVESLAVKAWELFPEQFALRGFPQFPDNHKVHSTIAGNMRTHERHPRYCKVADHWQLTPLGRKEAGVLAGMLQEDEPAENPGKPSMPISSESERRIAHLLSSEAFILHRQGLKLDIRYSHALAFYSTYGILQTEKFLLGMQNATAKRTITLSNGMEFDSPLCEQIWNAHLFLATTFRRRLKIAV